VVALSPSDLPPRVVQDRKSPRKRTLLAGRCVYGEPPQSKDCRIRDLSAGGARITLSRGECVPTRLFLIERRTGVAYEARVAWIKATDFGLKFLRAIDLEGEVPAELGFLNRIWADFRSPLAGMVD